VSPTPLAATTRYIAAGQTRIYWVESIAVLAWPTRAEIDAGIDLTGQVATVVGWHVRRRVRSGQAYRDDFEVQLHGSMYVDDSRLVFYGDQTGGDVSATLPEGTKGHVLHLYGGDVADNPMDVWPVRVAALGRGIELGDDPARIDMQFTVRGTPALGRPVPAVA
jgi:hypothetical protein